MDNRKIRWCKDQKKGITLIDPKPHLSESYVHESDDTLDNMTRAKGKWKLIMAYYACYNSLYALLMLAGIRSEIHDCTIELMPLFGYEKNEYEYLKDLKDKRIKAQYYLKDISLDDEKPVMRFVHRSRTLISCLNDRKIEEIRRYISSC